MNKHGTCKFCSAPIDAILYRKFSENGAESFYWSCPRCNRMNPFGSPQLWIPKEAVRAYLTEEEIELLPINMPNLCGRCTRCGARGAELHHWAPRAIFGNNECEQWPKDYLCKSCHDIWHQKVTPQLVK